MFSLPDYVERLRKDLRFSRCHIARLDRSTNQFREKADKLEEENNRLKQENNKLRRENGNLKEEIEKLTKTKTRYQVSLFDHGNFKHPDDQIKKSKGGQKGHADTNKDGSRDYSSFNRQRLYTAVCGKCGHPLSRTGSTKEKTLVDIEINQTTIQMIIQAERQWCGSCHREIRASHPRSLPFTEYGINTFMTVMYLHSKGNQSLGTITLTLNNLFGLSITKSGVGSLLYQARDYLQGKYEELKEAIRHGEIMYNDETGWMVRGKPAWMWIMTTGDKKSGDGELKTGMTVYVAAESRGKGIFAQMYGKSSAFSMHDGYAGYEAVTGEEKTAYCWSHVIRFAFEETVILPKNHPACIIRDRLVNLYQTIRANSWWANGRKEALLRKELDELISIQHTDQTVRNIQQRIKTQKEGLILSLLITEDGTNNLAEREFRQLAINRNISYGSDTYGGMETTAILASVVQTVLRDKTRQFLPVLKSYLQEGIKNKYPQYKHIPLFDT